MYIRSKYMLDSSDACDAPEVQCPVCFRVEGGDTLLLEQLECDPRHKVCSECMTRIVSHARSQRISVSCPLCRASMSLAWQAARPHLCGGVNLGALCGAAERLATLDQSRLQLVHHPHQ